jgi:hypothetical protein
VDIVLATLARIAELKEITAGMEFAVLQYQRIGVADQARAIAMENAPSLLKLLGLVLAGGVWPR